ncbi:phosphoglycerate mutase family protein [Pseudooceanicola batsensis HTCC2597]|uniref:Phosphoglycerate mutase family protein n=1 Tax=Pseudooceanicola batsensis (strain ATCC BAA-863 / DSM 15984 / KCTC 12145 / HTCC2597) TaxID=252305 RepID=A3TTV5_PSEBH|nr:histidine phosphatase family protein [Pseudooceanicola batsensis]EAQ05082.1 phosphoglycerate mutase family protein [Pseudooceanicola batsensis HTCC2597]
MTRFHMVRHGPTHEKTFVGWRDVPADLSDLAALARLDAGLPADALVISSDLGRAVRTADAIAGSRRRLPHDRDLREFDFGDWDGRHHSEASQSHPDLSRAFWERPGDLAAPNGESWNAVARRVAAVFDRLHRAHPGADIVVVGHFGMILTQLGIARQQEPVLTLGQKIDNLSVTSIRRLANGWDVDLINHIY